MLAVAFLLTFAVQDTAATRARADSVARVRSERAQRRAARQDSIQTTRRLAAAAAAPDAYADPGALDIVTNARAARSRNERLVTDYQVNVTQRIGVGIRALHRDRMLFGQELSARIEWHRDAPTVVHVTGARQRIPVAIRGNQVPDDLDASVNWLVLDPAADYLRLMGNDAEGFSHPLREDSEGDYRFASGDTTTITLPDGHTIRLYELKVRARRADFKLMNGSLWFDADSYGLVRAVFSPARPFDIEMDGDSGDADDIPAFVKPIRAEVKYVTIEYGLYEFRWWMPRYFAFDAEAQASVLRVPMRFERTYDGYHVQGGTEPTPGARRPAGSVRPQGKDSLPPFDKDSMAFAIAQCVQEQADSAAARASREREQGGVRVRVSVRERSERQCRRQFQRQGNWPIELVVPADTASLLTSSTLGEPILAMGDVITESELRQLGRDIGAIPQQPWQYRPRLPDGVGAILKNARYNRVEALSLGASATLDFGRLRLDGLARIGIADLEPNGELSLTRPARNAAYRLGAYRRLSAANPDTRPFGILNSSSAFFMQRDDGEYYRSWGVELAGANTNAGWWSGRLYAEHQRAASVKTQVAMPHLFDHSAMFRPNISALTADQVGGSLTLRGSKTLSTSVMAGVEATVDGATGTYDFGRGMLTARLNIIGIGPMAIGAEASAGTSSGAVPTQSLFYLGGPATLRGYTGGALAGEAFWRGRLETGTSIPAARLLLFTDAGWAGNRPDFSGGRPVWGAGVGISVLDGLFRMDLARRLSGQRRWRFDFYLDGIL